LSKATSNGKCYTM